MVVFFHYTFHKYNFGQTKIVCIILLLVATRFLIASGSRKGVACYAGYFYWFYIPFEKQCKNDEAQPEYDLVELE